MSREPILGRLDRDLACAIALGIVDYPLLTVTPEAVTLRDEAMRELGTERGWLDGDDPLDTATRAYLEGRRDAMLAGTRLSQGGWAGAAAVREREKGNQQANQAKIKAREILDQRGTLTVARDIGMRIFD
jgi:hypothetical protein